MPATEIAGQLNAAERDILTRAVLEAPIPPRVLLEVGTWLGGGSTLHLLRALEQNGVGHLWGIEADRSIYDRMIANLREAAPESLCRFTPVLGFSDKVIPDWLKGLGADAKVEVAFLDGGDNPMEQVSEFQLLEPHIPVGGQLLSHDAKLRKGRWLVPYVSALDNWSSQLHDVSAEGLFQARKTAPAPSTASRRAAGRLLRRMRCEPVELIGRLLPARVCALILNSLPKGLKMRVSQGR